MHRCARYSARLVFDQQVLRSLDLWGLFAPEKPSFLMLVCGLWKEKLYGEVPSLDLISYRNIELWVELSFLVQFSFCVRLFLGSRFDYGYCLLLVESPDVCVGVGFLDVFAKLCQVHLSIGFDVNYWFLILIVAYLQRVS